MAVTSTIATAPAAVSPRCGKYAFSVYGLDGFLTSFADQVVPAGPERCGRIKTNAAPAPFSGWTIHLG